MRTLLFGIAALALASCGQQGSQHELDGRWEVQQIAGASLGDGVDAWIEFDQVAEIANGYTGCHPFSATLNTFGATATFGPVNEAPGDCASEAAAVDQARLLGVLPAVRRFSRRGASLELLPQAQGSEALMRLRRVETEAEG